MSAPESTTRADRFDASQALFDGMVGFLDCAEAAALSHAELEERLDTDGRALLRQLFADHLELRAQREVRVEVVAADGVAHGRVESGHARRLTTVFGEVPVRRLAYRAPGQANLHPADGLLNLPEEKHPHGLRRWAAVEASRGSFDAAVDAIERATGQQVGKRQVESLAQRAAADADAFYAQRSGQQANPQDVLVISVDGKGIVMRPDALREGTKRASEASTTKLKTRLSKGEKRGRKRMAELGAVYDVTPVPRRATDVLASKDDEPVEAPVANNKWLTASVVEDAAEVIGEVFAEAERKDPQHLRTWVALVDGNRHQIDRIQAEAKHRELDVTIVIDLIHVLEYLSAPRGARLYPPPSGERLEGTSLGPMAYLALKKKGDRSMPLNQRSCPGVWGGALGDPRDMAKARLPESQFPEGASRTPAGKTPETGAAPAPGSICAWRNLPGYGAMPSEGIQGNEWDA